MTIGKNSPRPWKAYPCGVASGAHEVCAEPAIKNTSDNWYSDSRLIAAAANAFISAADKLGVDPILYAESMADGKLAEMDTATNHLFDANIQLGDVLKWHHESCLRQDAEYHKTAVYRATVEALKHRKED